MTPRIFSTANSHTARRAAFACLAASLLALSASGLRVVLMRRNVAELQEGVTGRKNRLRENRKAAANAPKGPKPIALDRSIAVSKLRSTLIRLASEGGIVIDEFQASTEELPYVTVYSNDSNDAGWMQVAVRFSITGRSPKLAAAVASLRTLEVPFEVDSVEMTRRSTDNAGKSLVAEQVQLRVLVYRGEA